MASVTIELGSEERAAALFAYPNGKDHDWNLSQTILHWVNQSIRRDFFEGKIEAQVGASSGNTNYDLILTGESSLQWALDEYKERLSAMYEAGWEAHQTVIPKLKKENRWDPRNKDWRFFMPMGLPVVNTSALNFFHYPPQKMLLDLQDYLNDPVPHRIENLIMASGQGTTDRPTAQLFETIIDGCPIAAPDDAGSAPGGDKEWGLIPIQFFQEYQKKMVRALIRPNHNFKDYTIPIVVFGSHPRKIFGMDFLGGKEPKINDPLIAEIVPGLKTPVIAANHPYNFYWTSQVGSDNGPGSVGDGHMQIAHCGRAHSLMHEDLVSVIWMQRMSSHANDGIDAAIEYARNYVNDRPGLVCALTQSQATLQYTNAAKTIFEFRVDQEEAAKACAEHGNNTCSFQV